ncbi:MAG TPA: serine hydrolase [Trebonia sp.]|nr:serine hydrolase [Trebonia sp.]
MQLATHTSGLPRLSPGITAGAADPYAFLTPKVAGRELRLTAGRPRGVDWDYSNFGFQVLSLALERPRVFRSARCWSGMSSSRSA